MPAHPVLRSMAPLVVLAVEEVLEVLEGLFEPLAEVEEAADVGFVDPEEVGPRGAVDSPAICA